MPFGEHAVDRRSNDLVFSVHDLAHVRDELVDALHEAVHVGTHAHGDALISFSSVSASSTPRVAAPWARSLPTGRFPAGPLQQRPGPSWLSWGAGARSPTGC